MRCSKKAHGDIAEQAVTLALLCRGWAVLHPVGDRLPYDLAVDTGERFVKVQVRCAYVVNGRGWRVGFRKGAQRRPYEPGDADYFVVVIPAEQIMRFFVLPAHVAIAIPGELSVSNPAIADYEGRWDQLAPTDP